MKIMHFDVVAKSFAEIEKTSLRNEKTRLLARLFSEVTPKEAKVLTYLAMGRLAPLYLPLELGMAEKSLIKVIARASKKEVSLVEQKHKEAGDLGEVVYQYWMQRESKVEASGERERMSIVDVYARLWRLAQMRGEGSQEKKMMAFGQLILDLAPMSAKYVVRLVAGKLRLGFSEMTILDALSWAKVGDKSARSLLEYAYNVSSDMGMVAKSFLLGQDIEKMQVLPGVPVRPMRAERLGTLAEMVAKMERFAIEPKMDGMRVQIHAFGKSVDESEFWGEGEERLEGKQEGLFVQDQDRASVKIFSRGLEDITQMFPEVVAAARELWVRVGDFVLDGEAIGVKQDGSFLPFQETIKRKRKYEVGVKSEEIPVKVFVFDTLFAFGKDRLRESYEERRAILSKLLQGEGVLELVESREGRKESDLREAFERAIKRGCEGILVKKIDSQYRAGARDFAWVKYKRAHEKELADTIEAVVLGAYVGKGKRQKFGVGAFLVGVRAGEKIVTIAKIGTGLTDEQFGELSQRIQKCRVEKGQVSEGEFGLVPKSLTPDIWVRPEIVVEIEADEITESPLHTAGYALRFPRLVRFRDDKKLADITEVAEVRRLFEIGRGVLVQ